MFCKFRAYMKYYIAKVNISYDRIKEPWRFFLALAITTPCWWGLGADNYSIRYITIAYLIVVLGIRAYGEVIIGGLLKK